MSVKDWTSWAESDVRAKSEGRFGGQRDLASTYVLHPSQMSVTLISNLRADGQSGQSWSEVGQGGQAEWVRRIRSARQKMIQYLN